MKTITQITLSYSWFASYTDVVPFCVCYINPNINHLYFPVLLESVWSDQTEVTQFRCKSEVNGASCLPRSSSMGRSASALHRRTSPWCLTRAPLTSGCPPFTASPGTRRAVSLEFWWGTEWLLEVLNWYFPPNSLTSLFSAPSSLQLQKIQHVCSERRLVFHQVPEWQFDRLHQRGHAHCEFQTTPTGRLFRWVKVLSSWGSDIPFVLLNDLCLPLSSSGSPDCRSQACVCLVSSLEKQCANLAGPLLTHSLMGSWAWPIRP